MKGYTFIDLIVDVIRNVKKPLAQQEIWDKAVELKFSEKLSSIGKTPWQTIGARIYTDIKDNNNTPFIQISKRPTKFYLKELMNDKNQEVIKKQVEEELIKEELQENKAMFNERDLHPLLVKFVYSHQHFKCFSKTIFHEKSGKNQKGYNEWLHPDIVGVYFPFKDFLGETQKLQEAFKISSFKLFSFELKKKLSFINLREFFFQAVSNSSWANEGYLVVLDIDDDPVLKDEIRRLSNSFGIGVIRLNATEIEQSEILFPAEEKEVIDWETVDRLADENIDFKDFISNLVEDIKLGKVKSNYDEVLSEENYDRYIEVKKIRNKE